MRKRNVFGMVRHAGLMVGRTFKSYALLSVTVVLSFSLLLGYLCYTDSSLYNQYKTLFSYRRGDLVLHDSSRSNQKLQALLEKISEVENTQHYLLYESSAGAAETVYAHDSGSIRLHNWHLYFYPDHSWTTPLFWWPAGDIVWTDGRPVQDIRLDTYEAVINEGLYFALGFDKLPDPVYTFRFDCGLELTLQIVGYAKDPVPFTLDLENGTEGKDYANNLILSTKLLDAEEAIWAIEETAPVRYIVIHTGDPEQVRNLAQNVGYEEGSSVFSEQNQALEVIRMEKRNKAIITCALLLLLGVNLYSCFTNALHDRKFEIGVKRAMGASAFSIVRQFLYESLMVMAVNILLSVVLVTDVFLVFKFIYERTPNEWGHYLKWAIYISPHSAAMFAVCAVSLTIVFSLIFACQSTRVEIVQYLKAE